MAERAFSTGDDSRPNSSSISRRTLAAGLLAAPATAFPTLAQASADQQLVEIAARIPDLRARRDALFAEFNRTEELAWAARRENRPLITAEDREIFKIFADDEERWEPKKWAQARFERSYTCSPAFLAAFFSRLAELAPTMECIEQADKRSDTACGFTAAEEAVDAFWDEMRGVILQMEAIRATTIEGLRAKARMAAFYHSEAVDPDTDDEDTDSKVVNMIARDLLALGGANV
jgi:hypothetical protein